jgi:hypothetical protein
MDDRDVIRSQFCAALEMLKQTITKCPDVVWDDPNDKIRFWRIAYHALFYTHLYLQDSEQAFVPWPGHRPEYQYIGTLPWPPHSPPRIEEAFGRQHVLDFLTFCQERVDEQVPHLNLDGPSGFEWLPFGRLELQFYNIRHLQQHIGELMERLGSRAQVELDWVGTKPT